MDEPTHAPEAPLDASELMRLVPHRPPFFFLRRLVEWSPGRRSVSEVEFDGSEEFFRGHFPGRPIVPGVILIEAAAQTAGFALALSDAPDAAGLLSGLAAGDSLPALAKVKEFRFREPVRPREKLTIEATVANRFAALGAVAVVVRRGATTVAEGELTIALATKPRP